MREPMSPEFVMAFVSTCVDAGLTKEATAELLQYQSVLHEAEHNPAFAEGFAKTAASVPGNLAPMFREGYINKSAALGTALRSLLTHIGGTGRALGSVGRELASGAHRAGKRVAGPGNNWIRRNPMVAAGVAAAVPTAGAVGAHYAFDRPSVGEVPYLAPNGYSPASSQGLFDAELNSRSQGIADINKRIDDIAARREVLEKAVTEHGPQSQMAQAELNQLNKEYTEATKRREGYDKQVAGYSGSAGSAVDRLMRERQGIEAKKTDWLHMPQRAYYRLTQRDPNDIYNKQLEDLEGPLSRANTNLRMSNELLRRSSGGYTGSNAENLTDEQMKSRFFPTS